MLSGLSLSIGRAKDGDFLSKSDASSEPEASRRTRDRGIGGVWTHAQKQGC